LLKEAEMRSLCVVLLNIAIYALFVVAPAQAADPNAQPQPPKYSPGATDNRGNYYTRSGPGVMDKDGTYYAPTGKNGYINSKTGEVIPRRNR
jgi:hypothetical protein